MNCFQRVWYLLMLALAGAGPLPLWLHRAACHTHVHQHEALTVTGCGHGSCEHARPLSRLEDLARPAGLTAAEIAKPLRLAAPDHHEECATCYLLSQATEPVEPQVFIGLSELAGVEASAIESPATAILLAYASRGPPMS